MDDLCRLTASELAPLIAARKVSSVEAVKASLARIEAVNPALNCFCFVFPEEALKAAEAADAAVARGDRLGLLHGVPVAFKDLTPTKGQRTTLGSKLFEHNVPDHDAVIVTKAKGQGAIVVGKTTTPEFAYSSFTHSPLWGVTRNPWDTQRTPGGSSGGSGAAVASCAVPLAEGSDMGGSIRIPASFSGIVGLKPSLGRIPFTALPSQFDNLSHFGPLARSCADAALFVEATQGPDDGDIQSIPTTLGYDGSLERPAKGLRLALSVDLGYYVIAPEVAAATRAAAERFRAAGAEVEEVDLGWRVAANDIWMDYWRVFMAAFFGEAYDRGAHLLDPNVKQLIEDGRKISAVAYKRLEFVRTALWEKLAAILGRYDALLCPTMAKTAPLAEGGDREYGDVDADGRYDGLDVTSPFNLTPQCPALSVPNGLGPTGLPIGLQIVGRRFDDLGVLKIGALHERLSGPAPLAPFAWSA
ncbi:amidase [Zavarzinia sp. CC-PAN008]|uniref:amidase n=1 Tax=Zavarzinia sp. CC-PAN008 TaxID=3243332 RepID=UPI003F74905F